MSRISQAYTTRELVDLLSITQQSIDKRSKKEGWQAVPRLGRGGGSLWLYSSMPEETRLAILARAAVEESPRAEKQLATLPKSAQDKAGAKSAILQLYKAWTHSYLLSHPTSSQQGRARAFAKLWGQGAIPLPESLLWVKETIPSFFWQSLYNWEEKVQEKGTAALAGEYGKNRGKGRIDCNTAMKELVIGLVYEYPHIRPCKVYEGLQERFPDEKLPCLRRVQGWLAEWKENNKQLYAELINPDCARSRYMTSFGNLTELYPRMNMRWEMDSTPWDIMTADGKRHTIVGLIDVHTRALVLHSTKTSSAHAVASTLKKGLLAFGIPELVVMDNGKDYAAAHIQRVMLDLNILQEHCPPFSPWKKPFIERAFRTFSHDLLEYEDGYIGHNVPERQAIRERKRFADRLGTKEMEGVTVCLKQTEEELQAWLDDWCLRYNNKAHTGIDGKTPFDLLELALPFTRRITNPRSLDILLLPIASGSAGWRTVSKKGVRAGLPGHYWSPELAPFVGKRVLVKVDDTDLSVAYLFDEDEKFLCLVRNSLLHEMTWEDAKAATRLQKAVRTAEKKIMAIAAISSNAKEIPKEILIASAAKGRKRAEEIEALTETANREGYFTPAMQEAALALSETTTPRSHSPNLTTEEVVKVQEKALSILQTEKAWKIPATDAEKWEDWKRIDKGLERGAVISFEEENWHHAWKNSRAFKNFILVFSGDMAL